MHMNTHGEIRLGGGRKEVLARPKFPGKGTKRRGRIPKSIIKKAVKLIWRNPQAFSAFAQAPEDPGPRATTLCPPPTVCLYSLRKRYPRGYTITKCTKTQLQMPCLAQENDDVKNLTNPRHGTFLVSHEINWYRFCDQNSMRTQPHKKHAHLAGVMITQTQKKNPIMPNRNVARQNW